ncbi:MAG: lipopolysaccharide heptosyltransferase I [Deltaproteobacteria bacterium]|nr:lipopolysaccharide heptosyltransferase I [Deltaproteobacteria bacterium]
MDIEGPPVNILIVKLSAIGDVIHTLPSLDALRRLYPDAHITWVVEEEAADLVVHHPQLDRVIVFKRKSWMNKVKAGQFRQAWRDARSFLARLHSRRYDLVIDFHGLFKSSIVVCLSRGQRKLGYDSWQELTRLFLNDRIPEDMNKHAVDRYLDFPRHLGAAIGKPEFIVPISPAAKAKSRALLDLHQLEAKKYIAVNPVALWDTKLWDDQKFARLADLISRQMNIPVVFTGRDKESLDKITAQMATKAINIGGQTTLPELACIYRDALAVITTDSGPMHLAAAVGTPVIALFGPTDPTRTGPYGENHVIIRTGISCSPCFLKKCPTQQCMEDITPEQVLEAVEKTVLSFKF